MKVSQIVVSDSFTRNARGVAVNFSETARRANFAALLREYRRNGFKVRTIERGAMYRADAPQGYYVNVWYCIPNVHNSEIGFNRSAFGFSQGKQKKGE